jgi:hypothetical protein
MFRMVLKINRDCFPKQKLPADFRSRDVMCFLWVTNWNLYVYILSRRNSVSNGLRALSWYSPWKATKVSIRLTGIPAKNRPWYLPNANPEGNSYVCLFARMPLWCFYLHKLTNSFSRTMALGSTQPLTEMSTGNLPGGKGRPARGADNLTICEPIV